MNDRNGRDNASKQIGTYVAIVLAASIPWYVIINARGGLSSGGGPFVLALMWMPALAGITTALIFQRSVRGMGWGFGAPKYVVIAYCLPILYGSIAYGVVWFLSPGNVDSSALDGNWIADLLRSLTVGVLFSAILTTGEEIGWRGLLVPQLARRAPFASTALMSGIVWGVWHIPIIDSGGYGSNVPAWWGVACFMLLIIGVSFPFAWLRLASGSIWPAVIMHSVHNTVIQNILDRMARDTGNTANLVFEFSLALAVLGIIVGAIFWRMGKALELTKQESTVGNAVRES